jgi:hypothetical protein
MGSSIAIDVNSRTPESVVLLINNDGTPDVAPPVVTRSAILPQLMAGPLQELLARTVDWTGFNLAADLSQTDSIRINALLGGIGTPLTPPNSAFVLQFVKTVPGDISSNGIQYSITGGEGASAIMVELRFEHSKER